MMKKLLPLIALLALAMLYLLGGCQHHAQPVATTQRMTHAAQAMEFTYAIAVLHPTLGNQARGYVRFTQLAHGVGVLADVYDLPPNTARGFHIHEYGDCSASDAASAGGHYNPQGYLHAGPDTERRHAGDLGNLVADDTGHAHLELIVTNISIIGTFNPIIGRSVVVHAEPDDLVTQPTGNSGGRIACGVIGVTKAP